MLRVSAENINPDLARERARATINAEAITYIFDEGKTATERRRELGRIIVLPCAVAMMQCH